MLLGLESDAWKLQRGLWKNYFFLLHPSFCSITEAFWKRGAHWLCIYEYILLQPHRAMNTGNHEAVALLCSSVPELIALVVSWCQGWDPIPPSSPRAQRHGLGEAPLTDVDQDMDMKTSPLPVSRCGHQDFIEWVKTWTLPKCLVCLGLSKPFPKPPKLWLNREWQDATSGFGCSLCVFCEIRGGRLVPRPASWPCKPCWSPGAGGEGWGTSLAPYNLPKHGGSHFFFVFVNF